jgi:hypothetical protein
VKRFKGPELKLSELKAPVVLRDLYWDLRDRRLLPLVGLVVVAIAAAPFLLGGGSKEAPEPPAPAPIAGGVAHESATLTVLPAEPGLREPSKRLAGLAAKDPFRQHYTGPVLKEGAAPIAETSTSGGSAGASIETAPEEVSVEGGSPPPSPEPAPAPNEPSGGGSGGSGSGTASPGQIQLFTFAIDVKVAHTEVTKSGAKKMSEAETRERVLPTTPLPGKKSAALTYLGVDPKTGKEALMLVSPEVVSLFGDAKCVSGTSTICQLIALKPGTPEVVEYGPNGVRYKVEVLKIEPVTTAKVQTHKE